jgi:hypothetical protein
MESALSFPARESKNLPAASDAVDDALLSELSELSDEPVCEEEPEEDATVVVPALPLAGAEAPVADDAAVTTPVGVLPLT